jgi:SAM-dependent methyltransferase
MEQRLAFNQIADLYDKGRPDYPQPLFDDVCALAALGPSDAVLDVGCGTGKAAGGFARRGYRVTALDPGADLIGVARSLLGDLANIRFVQSSFEDWPVERAAYRLVVSAQAFHWIAPEMRFVKAAAVLAPGGSLAVFGNVAVGLAEPLLGDLRGVYARHVPAWAGQQAGEVWYLPSGPIASLFDGSGLFGPVTHRCYPWCWHHTTTSYVDFLRTRSDHQLLGEGQREALLAALAGTIDAHGGMLELQYQTHLYVAPLRT